MVGVIKKYIATVVFAISTFFAYSQNDDGFLVKKGDMAPQFTVEMTDGTKVDITALRGNVVLINFWATWCPYCVKELDMIQNNDMLEPFAGDNFIFLPISIEGTKETLEKFIEKRGYRFKTGMDPERDIYGLFAKRGIPKTLLIDKEGKIVVAMSGYHESAMRPLVKKIEKELKK